MKAGTDGFVASMVWGRIGAAVLCMIAFALQMFGVDVTAEDQAAAVDTVSGILAGVAAILALVSKYREQVRKE